MSLVILFHFLCAQHVSDINISIIRSLRLCCWFTTSVVLFSVRCVLEIWCDWFWVVLVLQAEAETCWAHKKWNKIASDIKLFFHSSTIRSKMLLSHKVCVRLKFHFFFIVQNFISCFLITISRFQLQFFCNVIWSTVTSYEALWAKKVHVTEKSNSNEMYNFLRNKNLHFSELP